MMHLAQKLYLRLLSLLGRGRITLVDDSGGTQTLQIVLGPLETRDALPRMAEYGFTSNPPADTDAVMVCIGGDRSRGIVIATGHQVYRLKSLAPGDVALYDDLGQKVHLTRSGIVID
ncbi:MAG: phage baseplate assembly protein, partial [Betaproteobacteria bacterium]|nr:phage baseplate assembly protein [Betaproteobacteria bacterium]